MALANRVAIIGTGTIRLGENFHQSYTDMVYEAATLVLSDAGGEPGNLRAVNTSGGLKSGTSGVRMVNNIADQLLGRAGRMQVPRARMGLAHTLGGPGAASCVAVLGQP